MKIDTQGMSYDTGKSDSGKTLEEQRKELPKAVITPQRLFTPEYVKEMKILINEVLDEREYNKRMRGEYDIGGYELPPSYFDTEQFKHIIGEPEPPYQDWSQ
tara:strand:+ start:589 stop:894 length:306 start_codon:yes stop_codon:yes gene_type:complete